MFNCLFSPSAEVRTQLPEQSTPSLFGYRLNDFAKWAICLVRRGVGSSGMHGNGLTPADVHGLITEEPTRTSVLGLLSFHRNGYVRHEAVRLLAQSHDASELPYLLIRQNDWVEPIRADARRAVQARLDEGHLSDFVTNLSLVIHLLAFQRQDHGDVVRRVIGMLVQPQHDKLLTRAIRSPAPMVRRGVVRLALDSEGEHRPRVVELALSSTDGVIRLWGSRHVRPCFSGKALEGILGSLRRDRIHASQERGADHPGRYFP